MESKYAPKKFKANEWKENLEDFQFFYKQLEFDELKRLLKDKEFKKFICNNLTNVDYVNIFYYLDEEETLTLLDEYFIKELNIAEDKQFEYLYSRLDKYAFGQLILKEGCEAIINYNVIWKYIDKSWSIDVKKKLLNLAVKNKISDNLLANLTKNIYYVKYDYEQDIDYSNNEKEIKMMSEFLNSDDVVLKYYNSFDLLSSLDPENRSNYFIGVKYEELTQRDKKNLLGLLSQGYETKLSSYILSDVKFFKDVANINAKDFRVARLMIKDLSEMACEGIDGERFKVASKNMIKISEMSYRQIKSEGINLDEILDDISYAYFRCSSRDVFIKACLLKDAINTFPEFEQKFTKSGLFLIDKLIDMLKFQKDLIQSERKKKGQSLVCCTEQNFEDLQDVIGVLRMKSDWKELFDKSERVAKKYFTQDLSEQLYELDEKDLKSNEEGLKVYDITKHKKFHLLIHGKTIYNIDNYEFPEVGKEDYLNTSVSILNNNHLGTFADEAGKPYKLTERGIVFGYCSVAENEVVHALPSDAFTNLVYVTQNNKDKFKKGESSYAPTYIPLKDIMGNTYNGARGFNEIKLHRKANKGNKVIPDYILCRDEIREIDKEFSKKYNIPIVFINLNKVQKFEEKDIYTPILYDKSVPYGGVEYQDIHLEQ